MYLLELRINALVQILLFTLPAGFLDQLIEEKLALLCSLLV